VNFNEKLETKIDFGVHQWTRR